MTTTLDQPVPVTFLITELDPGGAEKAMVALVTRLNKERWSPRVICLSKEGVLCQELQEQQIPVDCLGAGSHWDLWPIYRRLIATLKRHPPRILCSYLFHANLLGRFAARKLKVSVVLSGIRVAEKRSRWKLWLDRWTEQLVTRHLCVSQAVADFSIERGGLSSDKISVLPNGVDLKRFQEAEPFDWNQLGIPSVNRVYLAVGRLDHQKGCIELFQAFAELKPANATLIFVGEGPLRQELERKIASLPQQTDNPPPILLLGQRDDVPELMQGAQGLILASRWEGAPNVLLEALAAGLPVLATDVEGVREILQEGALGTLIPADDFEALKLGVNEFLKISPTNEQKQYSPLPFAKERLTWNQTRSLWEEIAESCLKDARS